MAFQRLTLKLDGRLPFWLPADPPLKLDTLFDTLETANRALGRLDDVEEVSNYVAAMDLGVRRMREGMPPSNRLIRELHAVLLRGGRGSNKRPGEFRRSQNWLGGTRPGNARFLPPPPNLVADCMSETSKQAADTAKELLALFDKDRKSIERLGRSAGSALQVHQYLQTRALLSVPAAARSLALSAPTVRKSVNHLIDLGILKEITGKRRDRLFAYEAYIDTLAKGTEPVSR